MKKNIFKKNPLSAIAAAMVPNILTLCVTAIIISGLNQTETSSKAEGLRILEDSLRRAVITCYAVEGNYPHSLSYIAAHYGVHIDRSRYSVHYEIFASNIFPNITVIEK